MKTKGLELAADTTKQIITLSTGIVALTVTFAKEFKPSEGDLSVPVVLKISWLFYCAAVVTAVWTLMAITGTVDEADQEQEPSNPTRLNIRVPACLMVVAFLGGIVTTAWSGFQVVR